MSSTVGGGVRPGNRCRRATRASEPGMVIQELGWDNDADDELRVAIEDTIDADMVDGDYGNVVDAVLLWWRDDDGDLVDGLVDALDRPGRAAGPSGSSRPRSAAPERGRGRRRGGGPDRGPLADDDGGGQHGLAGEPAGRAQDARLTRHALPRRRDPHCSTSLRAAPPPARPRRCACSAEPGSSGPTARARSSRLGRTIARWGTGPAGGFASLAVRDPDRVGLVDELGELTFGEMHRRSNALARGLAGAGRRRGRLGRGHVPQPPRLRRRHRSRSPSSAPTCSTSTPPSPARSWSTCSSASSRPW